MVLTNDSGAGYNKRALLTNEVLGSSNPCDSKPPVVLLKLAFHFNEHNYTFRTNLFLSVRTKSKLKPEMG